QGSPSLVKPGLEVFLVELDENLALLDEIAFLDLDFLDDAVGLGLDIDLGDRLNLADRDHGAGEVTAFDHGKSRRVNIGARPRHPRNAVGPPPAKNQENK